MIYVTGDTHGDITRFKDPQMKKLKKGDTLIICGDFGFIWDNSKKEKADLKKLLSNDLQLHLLMAVMKISIYLNHFLKLYGMAVWQE